MKYDTAVFETEEVSEYVTFYRIRRSDSDYEVMASPWETFLPHLKALEAEGFKSLGQHELVGPGKHIIRYRRERTGPVTAAALVEMLQRRNSQWPVTIALGPDEHGQYREVPIDFVYETEDRTIQLRGKFPGKPKKEGPNAR